MKEQIQRTKDKGVRNLFLLCFAVAVYSTSGLFSKLASGYEFLSFPYTCCLCGVILVLGIYAILWQMALKKIPLSQAYPFRSLGVVFGLAIAGLIFHETITLFNLLGSGLVIVGLLVITKK
jgi:drug/metabolite transporter (DMT)-like permease